jgi:hypothetical protein
LVTKADDDRYSAIAAPTLPGMLRPPIASGVASSRRHGRRRSWVGDVRQAMLGGRRAAGSNSD